MREFLDWVNEESIHTLSVSVWRMVIPWARVLQENKAQILYNLLSHGPTVTDCNPFTCEPTQTLYSLSWFCQVLCHSNVENNCTVFKKETMYAGCIQFKDFSEEIWT